MMSKMALSRGFGTICVLLSIVWAVSAQCPSICDCRYYDSLKEIRCNQKSLTSVPSNLPVDTQVLRLEFNAISSIGATDLQGLPNLKRLTLYNNQISDIDPSAFTSVVNLEYLFMQSNKIRRLDGLVFRDLVKLVELKLDNNQLTTFESGTFQTLIKLTELSVPRNPINSLPDGLFGNLSNLEILDISNSNLTTISSLLFAGLADLITLKINSITQNGDELFAEGDLFSSVSKLTGLEIKQNSLTRIPASVQALSNLRSLVLSNNPISSEDLSPFRDLQNLTSLSLDQTKLTQLRSRMFATNTNLAFLYIDNSQVSVVEENAFDGLSQLQELHLYANNLTTLPENVLAAIPATAFLDLSENPWQCDCNLRWLRDWLVTTHEPAEEARYHPVCATPERLVNQEVTAVESANYACPPHSDYKNRTHSVNQGQNVKMDCGIEGDPSPELHWLLPDHSSLVPGTSLGALVVDDACTLTIIRIQDDDAGSYSCVGTNLAGQVSVPNYVTVMPTGVGRHTTFASRPDHEDSTVGIVPQEQSGSAPVVPIVCVVVGLLVLVVVIALVIMRRRNKKHRSHGLEANFIFQNQPVAVNCGDTCANGIEGFHGGQLEARYADSLPRAPMPPLIEPPPPYTTLPPGQPTYEQIYDRIQDNAYETPMRPGETSTIESRPSLTHTYMGQVQPQRQDSQMSEKSCGAPAGYDRFVIRPTTQGNHYTSGVPAGARSGSLLANRSSNTPQKEKPLPSDAGVSSVDLDSATKVTYQNTRRE